MLAREVLREVISDNPRPNLPAIFSLHRDKALTVVGGFPADRVEVRAALYQYQIEYNSKNPNNPIHILSMHNLIASICFYELKYLTIQNFTADADLSQLEPNLINIYENYDTFILMPETEAEKVICPYQEEENQFLSLSFGRKPYRPLTLTNEHSVVDEETFLKRFHVFTNGMFEGWTKWDNMVVVGGSVQACLLDVPENFQNDLFTWYHKVAYKQSDIDICLFGLTHEQFAQRVWEFYKFFSKTTEVAVYRTPNTITLVSKWPRRHVQIVLAEWINIQDLLQESDIDCSSVAFDGKKVWTTQKGRFSYNHRCIVVTQKAYESRGNPHYQSRLIKFSRRGFSI